MTLIHIKLRLRTDKLIPDHIHEITKSLKIDDISVKCKQYSNNYAIQCQSIAEFHKIDTFISNQPILPFVSEIYLVSFNSQFGIVFNLFLYTDNVKDRYGYINWHSNFDIQEETMKLFDLNKVFKSL